MQQYHQPGAVMMDIGGLRVPAHFGEVGLEYEVAALRAAIHDRSYRGLIEISGSDCATWFNNLFTNDVTKLPSGEGNYGFALSVKGRILFDGNILILDDRLLLDLDRRWVSDALAHLNKYIIMEDVHLADQSGEFSRIGLIGPEAIDLAARLSQMNAHTMSLLQHHPIRIENVDVRLVHHDFAGPFGFELIVSADQQPGLWQAIMATGESSGLQPVGLDAVEILRIEAGIPWSCEDIDDQVIPAETGQIERAVSFTKGCYLGQEIVERMRAHQTIARLLVGLVFERGNIQAGAALTSEGWNVGRVTSAVDSIKLGKHIGLGYVNSSLANAGTKLVATCNDVSSSCQVCDLPFTH